MNFEYFNKPGRPYTDDRIELWCGDTREARRVRWDDLDDLLSRILEMGEAWGGEKERGAWKSWAHSVVLASTAQRALVHRPVGFARLDDAPDGTQWMLRINPYEAPAGTDVAKKEDDDER
jgi:hypothetical protein